MSRRGSNEGSIYRRQDGRWVGAISMGYAPSGRRRRRHVFGKTRAEVVKKLAADTRARSSGVQPEDGRTATGTYLERWLVDSAQGRLRPLTFQSYASVTRGHLIPAFRRIPLSKLQPLDVERHLRAELESGLSPHSVRNQHAILRRALNDAVRWGMITRNVAALVTPPRATQDARHPLSADEAQIFLAAVRDDRLAALYTTAIALGLRQGELLGLTWEAIDWDRSTLEVRGALQRYDGAFHLTELKTRRSRRTLSVPAPVLASLRARQDIQREEQRLAGPGWERNEFDLIFSTEAGGPLSAASVSRQFKRHLTRAGLRAQRFHDLRHAAASYMAAEGVPIRTAMEILGHSNIATTAEIYQHVAEESKRDAAERVAGLLWK